MKRILIYGMSSKVGGVEEYLMNVYRNLDRKEMQFDFIITDGNTVYCEEEIQNLGGKVYYPQNTKFIKKMLSLKKIIKQERKNHDTIYFNSCGMYNILPYLYAKIYRYKKIIVHAHNTKDTSRKEIIHMFHYINRWIISNFIATKMLACSRIAGEWIFGKNKIGKGKVEIIYNAIDIDRFKFNKNIRDKIRKELHIEGKFVIGHIGKFIYQKNHMFLLEVFNKVLEKRQDVVLLLIGEGNEKENIKDYVKNNQMDKNVLFLSTTKKIEELYQAMDLFVLPSKYEGLPVVGIEAQCNGLYCIFSDKITKELKLKDNVKFLDINHSEIWSKNIINLVANKAGRIENNEKIKRKYDIKKQINKIGQILGGNNEGT